LGFDVIRYLLRRIAYLVIVLFAATFMISAMLSLVPGDPAAAVAGENATPEQLAAVRKAMHLDQSLVGRYLTWVGHALRGDLGNSLLGARPISASIGQYLPVTLELVIVAQLLAFTPRIIPVASSTGSRPRFRPS
jgi:peptide/nickel transport system permease protein